MYGIFRERAFAETLFEKTGARAEDITIVVNTHLHFDHAGGNTSISDLGSGNSDLDSPDSVPATTKRDPKSQIPSPQFPNARYFVSESELEHANNPHERDRASYLPENWQPLIESGQLELKPVDYDVVEGLKMQTIQGHSKTMQTWRLDGGGQTVYGFADLIPTRHHVALPWIMGYDLYPSETLEFKKEILPRAIEEDWLCVFYHDFENPIYRIRDEEGKIRPEPVSPN